jgi:hypothetical protein
VEGRLCRGNSQREHALFLSPELLLLIPRKHPIEGAVMSGMAHSHGARWLLAEWKTPHAVQLG